jgi:hypothetical protein
MKLINYKKLPFWFHSFQKKLKKRLPCEKRALLNFTFLPHMESAPTTDRKGFLKRAGLAIVAIFAASSTARASKSGEVGLAADSEVNAVNAGIPSSALVRVRRAEGAVSRQSAVQSNRPV